MGNPTCVCRCPSAASIKRCFNLITVEPIIFFVIVAFSANQLMFQTIMKLKVCNLLHNYSMEFCINITESKGNDTAKGGIYYDIHEAIIKDTSEWQLYSTLLNTFPAVLIALFMGSWSDRIGRKIPIMLCCIGFMSSTAFLLCISLFMELPLFIMLFANMPATVCGGLVVFFMSAFSYLSEHSEAKNRTIAIAIADIIMYLSGFVGAAVANPILSSFGITGLLLFVISCFGLALIYTLLRIKKKSKQSQQDSNKSPGISCKGLFNFENIKDSVKTVIKKRENNGRVHLLILIFTMFVFNGIMMGGMEITYLYVNDAPISWDFLDYNRFNSFNYLVGGFGMIIIVPILKKCCKLEDTTMMLIGGLSRVGSVLLMAFAYHDWIIYCSGVVGILTMLPSICIRSLLSKEVEGDELGKLFSFIGSMETIAPALASPLYNKIFQESTGFNFPWRGIPFMISSLFNFINLCIYGFVHIERKFKYKEFINKPDIKELVINSDMEIFPTANSPDILEKSVEMDLDFVPSSQRSYDSDALGVSIS